MNVFQWLAGADQNILDQCSNSEKNKITGFGTLVLIPAIVGLFSMTYAISTITNNVFLYASGGIIWFFIILFIDKFIVATLYKSKLESKSNFIAASIARYAFALIVGIAVSHPMVLLWFNEGITEQIVKEKRFELKEADKTFETDRKSVSSKLDSLVSLKECKEKLKTAEQSGHKVELPCGFSSGIPNVSGNFHRTKEIQLQINDLDKQIEIERKSVNLLISDLKNQRNNDKLSIEKSKSFDYLARVKKLSQMQQDEETGSHIWWVSFFMILFFVFIDILPITMKVATPYGEYEAIKDSITYKTLTMKDAENKVISSFATTSYTTNLKAKLDHESKSSEISDIFNFSNKTVTTIENERKVYDKTANEILDEIDKTTDKDLKKDYQDYFLSVRNIFNESYKKSHDKFLSYLKSL